MSDNRTSLEAPRTGLSEPAGSTSTLENTAAAGSLADRPTGRRRSDRIILASSQSQQAVDKASALARSNSNLLIQGPPGSGRLHYARAIHEWSQRAGSPLTVFSATSTPESLQAGALFGSAGDANLEGATEGAIAEAGNGSLIIERIDLLAEAVRRRLLDAIQSGRYQAAGGQEGSLQARVIATAGSEAKSLFGEIPVMSLELTPLSERKEDILPLAAHFLAEFAEQDGLTAVGFTVDARRWLVEEPWAGNVRELRERIRQAVRLSGSGSVSAEALMLSTEGDEVPSFKEAKRAFETRYVEGLLRRCSGNISRAARLAKKDRKDFYDVIRRTGVDPAQFRT